MTDRLRIKELENEIINLKNKLTNPPYGLYWSNVREKTISIIDENNIVYGNKLYSYSFNIKSVKKNIALSNDNIKLTRKSDSYLFSDNTTEYLIFSDKAYSFNSLYEGELKPYFIQKGDNFNIGNSNENLLLEGDNLYSLELLQATHTNKIDVICIDPPYNTGNSNFIYNDQFEKLENGDLHSTWLSFIHRRLILAKNLLTKEGVIFINIDEFEFSNLKLLCDQLFGEENHVESFIWEKNSTKNNSKTTSNNHEHILCYAKNKKTIEKLNYFNVDKAGINEVYEIKNKIINDNTITNKRETLEKELVSFYKANKQLKGISQYKKVDEKLNIFRLGDVSAPGGGGKFFDIPHPVTGKLCKNPAGGFRYSDKKIVELLEEDRLHFGETENTVPQFKRYLDDMKTENVKSVIRNTEEGKKELEKLFTKSPFDYPKPTSLIKMLIKFINKKDILCLDFFAGSGSTGHAVWDLNKEDGQNRTFILCTNNENNICENVTFERLKRANEKYNYNANLSYKTIRNK